MARVLLAGKDWRSRALLRAQLIEEGIEVEACETVREALNSLTNLSSLPGLVIADLFGSEHPSSDLELLANWAPVVPVWLLLGREIKPDRDPEKLGVERYFYRPIDMEKWIEQIKKRVG
ncbi:MAG TPA: hypothetical protein VFZ08_07935 [Terriglobia bacterium]|nr:hypothetical protein [Terriglobia bacterium]